ncbi:MAG: hypothetical protein ACLQO7_07550, partial [Candidatus Bathyarchaeia archaeon]
EPTEQPARETENNPSALRKGSIFCGKTQQEEANAKSAEMYQVESKPDQLAKFSQLLTKPREKFVPIAFRRDSAKR